MTENTTAVLVTGGAGYIGSHAALALARRGFVPVTYDNLIYGHRQAVQWGPLVEGDIADRTKLVRTIHEHGIRAIMHFAGFTFVGESVRDPRKYFANNVTGSLALLDAAAETGVAHIVFSSTAAIYGIPEQVPIREDAAHLPVNPYGETKLAIERALRWYAPAYGMNWAALRYFNAAGADPDHGLGELHVPETHLIPLVLDAALGRRVVEVYGDDYPTPDGTCVRDYIHVLDLAEAHVAALEYLMRGGESIALNLGTGQGHSVKEVIAMVQRVTGREIPFRTAPRRSGDPAVLVADPSLAGKVLQWQPLRSSLEVIVSSAWRWHAATFAK